MTVHVTGRTFDHRDMLQRMNGWFNRPAKRWEFERLSEADLAKLRGTVGLVVNVIDKPSPRPVPSLSDTVDRLVGMLIGDDPAPGSAKPIIYGNDPTYFNHFAPRDPAAFFGFASVGALIDYIEGLPPSHASDQRRSGWTGDAWHGTRSMREAIDLARHGWQEGVDRAQDAVDRLTLENPRVRRRARSMAGGRVNVGRMLSGDPMHMTARPKLPGKKRITFFVEIGCSGRIETETLIMRAAMIGAMVDVMENRGYSASIVATDTSIEHIGFRAHTVYQLAVIVKEHGERLNLSDVVFSLGHPSFLRRFSFAVCSSVPETRRIWEHQGSPSNAFTEKHPCARGEFYVPVFTDRQQDQITNDPLSMLPFITPKGLPINLKGN